MSAPRVDCAQLCAAWDAWFHSGALAGAPADACMAELTTARGALARDARARAAAPVAALWGWLPHAWALWLQKEGLHTRSAPDDERANRAARAQALAALLGVARNSVAGSASAADIATAHWGAVVAMLDWALTFERMSDPPLVPVVRVLAQLLVNVATGGRAAQQAVWDRHVVARDAHVGHASADAALRLLASPDQRTALAAQVLILNSLRGTDTPGVHVQPAAAAHVEACARVDDTGADRGATHAQSAETPHSGVPAAPHARPARAPSDPPPPPPPHARDLVDTRVGRSILDAALHLYDAALLDDGEEVLEMKHITVAIVARLVECGLGARLLQALGPAQPPDARAAAAHVSAAQITCLQAMGDAMDIRLDARKHAARVVRHSGDAPGAHGAGATAVQQDAHWTAALSALAPMFVDLAADAVATMRAHREDRGRDLAGLIRVHMALLALLACLTHGAMCAQEDAARRVASADTALLARLRAADSGVVDACLDLLREAHRFFPPQNPFRRSGARDSTRGAGSGEPVAAAGHASAAPAAGHTLTSTGRADGDAPADRPSLYTLKRSALQLLAALAFHPQDARANADVQALQDHVRARGGLGDVLNMTMLDENNPYIREHAVFALRNLLAGNRASQMDVAAVRPE
ncbi:hypothetical protein MSPP1_003978 [Malassezia sp. CBS 17886]|nr:hypothetical protein MSPP1_003978 [Malassezia sp. CBS 17886]